MKNEVLNFLAQKDNFYLGNDKEIEIKEIGQLLEKDLSLYHIEEIQFDEKSSRKEAIENILSSIKIGGINFLYLVIGDENGVHFYFGIARDLYYDKEMELELEDIDDYILKPSVQENLLGSKISKLLSDEKKRIFETIDDMEYFSVLEGVPGVNSKTINYMDKLVNVMNGDKYGLLLIANPLDINDIWNIENNLSNLYTLISSIAVNNVQETISKSSTSSIATSAGESFTNVMSTSLYLLNSLSERKGGNTSANVSETNGRAETIQSSNRNNSTNRSIGISNNNQEGTNIGENWDKTVTRSVTVTPGISKSNTTDSSITEVRATTDGTATTTSIVTTNQEVQGWMTYMDEILFPRLDYGKGRGMFNISTFLFANNKVTLTKLDNSCKLLFTGKKGNKIPVRAFNLNNDSLKIDAYRKFQLPHGNFPEGKGINNPFARSALSQYLDDQGTLTFGNWVSANELSSIISLPQNEIRGLSFIKPKQLIVNIPSNIGQEEINNLRKFLKRLFGESGIS